MCDGDLSQMMSANTTVTVLRFFNNWMAWGRPLQSKHVATCDFLTLTLVSYEDDKQ
jgi:hypothetical protein